MTFPTEQTEVQEINISLTVLTSGTAISVLDQSVTMAVLDRAVTLAFPDIGVDVEVIN